MGQPVFFLGSAMRSRSRPRNVPVSCCVAPFGSSLTIFSTSSSLRTNTSTARSFVCSLCASSAIASASFFEWSSPCSEIAFLASIRFATSLLDRSSSDMPKTSAAPREVADSSITRKRLNSLHRDCSSSIAMSKF